MEIGDNVILSFKDNWSVPIPCKVIRYQEETGLYYGIDIKENTRCLGKKDNIYIKVVEKKYKQLTLF